MEWTTKDDAALERMCAGKATLKKIAQTLGRSVSAVAQRKSRLGLSKTGWTGKEDATLMSMVNEGRQSQKIAIELGRSSKAVRARKSVLLGPTGRCPAALWTVDDDTELQRMCAQKMSLKAISQAMGRSLSAIGFRKHKLGLTR